MFESSRYISNSLNVLFARQVSIRRAANDFEDKLKGNYLQPQIIGIPDELDPEVPRMLFSSTHGFSQIIVSQTNISLNVKYSPDWQKDISLGQKYLFERAPILFELLSLVKTEPLYFGLSTHVNLPSSLDDEKILVRIADSFLKEKSAPSTHDIQLKTTNVIDDKFFSNITLENYRIWKLQQPMALSLKLSRKAATEKGVSILGDFNDRYIFNEDKDYKSTQAMIEPIIELGLKEVQAVVGKVSGKP